MTAPGITRNNPGNIEIVDGVTWEGQSQFQTGRFVNFENPIWGIRAIARILITYADKHKIDTVEAAITRWAPPRKNGKLENDTAAYISDVLGEMGLVPDSKIAIKDYATMLGLVRAIIKHENGASYRNYYSQAQLDEGLRRAGIVKPAAPATKDSAININTISATAATVAGVVSSVEDVWNTLARLNPNLPIFLVAAAALVTVGACVYFIGRRLLDRKQGIA